MANRNTKAKRNAARKNKSDTFFHGSECITSFARRAENPANKRKSAWKAPKPAKKSWPKAITA